MSNKENYRHISEVAKSELINIEKRMSGEVKSLQTPWKCLNAAGLNGVPWQYIIAVAGMSGSGKTLFVNQLETQLFGLNPDEKFHVLSLNYEMIAERLVGRKLSTYLQKSSQQIYSSAINSVGNINQEELEKARLYFEELSKLPIWYQDIPETIVGIQTLIRKHVAEKIGKEDIGLIVIIDHSLLVKNKSDADAKQTLYDLGEMCTLLKKIYKITFIIISQLNRGIESEERRSIQESKLSLHFPIKSDITSADALFQHADIVGILHMPSKLNLPYYGPEKWPTSPNDVYLHFLKARDFHEFIAHLSAKYETMEITEKVKEQPKTLFK